MIYLTVHPPVSGSNFAVDVDSCGCSAATVIFRINGIVIDTKTCNPPATVTFACPAGTRGKTYEIELDCEGSAIDRASGVIV